MAEGEKLQRPRRRRDSRSNEHRTIELLALEMLSAQLGMSLRGKRRISVGNRKEVEVDGHCKEPKITVGQFLLGGREQVPAYKSLLQGQAAACKIFSGLLGLSIAERPCCRFNRNLLVWVNEK